MSGPSGQCIGRDGEMQAAVAKGSSIFDHLQMGAELDRLGMAIRDETWS
ncbi:hypothetical protein [Falsiroseomonas sp. HW251]